MIDITVEKIGQIISAKTILESKADLGMKVSKVSQDSRQTDCHTVFFAIKGIKFDGHDFLKSAYENGCRCFVVENEEKAISFAEKFSEGIDRVNFLLVESTIFALQDLAKDYLRTVNPITVAVTGSNGKTTTRDICCHLLSAEYKCHRNRGNYNTLVGVPLTILDMPEDTEVAVLEMGMDRRGEISILADLVRPHIAIITNIGYSHLERLGSREEIFNAKIEVCEHMGDEDFLIVGWDGEYLNEEKLRLKNIRTNLHFVGFDEEIETAGGGLKKSDTIIGDIKSFSRHSEFSIRRNDEHMRLSLNLPGKHNVLDAGLAVEAARILKVDKAHIAEALKKIDITGKRLEFKEASGVTIIDDSYNASPTSVVAAMQVLNNCEGRRIAVLGDMYELGEDAAEIHEDIYRKAAESSDILLTYGKYGEYSDMKEMERKLKEMLHPGDVVLFKASHGVGLGVLVDELFEYISKNL